ncbi:hypothetical protein THF5G08_230020 [Vibrio jasicida]|uniref:hypothetical protein n=1 Tax=Vibrio jasicida TaxID=766224 RepID=UPI0028948E03|nr:hypothetical protein THF5G08_230020 [Vibrio jasicida]
MSLSLYHGSAASRQLVQDIIDAQPTEARSPLGLINAGVGAFNAVVNTARKFKKNTTFDSLEFILYNNTSVPIVIESFEAPSVPEITDITPVICPAESKSIQTYDSRERDNTYYLMGRIGAAANRCFKMTFKNTYVEGSGSAESGSFLGLEKFELFDGSGIALDSVELSRDSSAGDNGGSSFGGQIAYIQNKEGYDCDFGLTVPLVDYNGTELYMSFHGI